MARIIRQVLNGNPYNRKCDVYSFGICLWEIYCCDMPYPDLSFSEVTSAVVRQVDKMLEIHIACADFVFAYTKTWNMACLVLFWFLICCPHFLKNTEILFSEVFRNCFHKKLENNPLLRKHLNDVPGFLKIVFSQWNDTRNEMEKTKTLRNRLYHLTFYSFFCW